MATDYFAHSVFGVVLEGKALKTFHDLYSTTKAKLVWAFSEASRFETGERPSEDEAEDLWYESVRNLDRTAFHTVLAAIPPKKLAAVRRAVGAPEDAAFLDTGGFDDRDAEDDRPGRSYTENGGIVVGYGPFTVLDMVKAKFKKRHRHRVAYESWVTAG